VTSCPSRRDKESQNEGSSVSWCIRVEELFACVFRQFRVSRDVVRVPVQVYHYRGHR